MKCERDVGYDVGSDALFVYFLQFSPGFLMMIVKSNGFEGHFAKGTGSLRPESYFCRISQGVRLEKHAIVFYYFNIDCKKIPIPV